MSAAACWRTPEWPRWAPLCCRAPAARLEAPAAPVALARCRPYGAELLPTLTKMFDQIGGLGRLVKGKTVAIKSTSPATPIARLGFSPSASPPGPIRP